MLPCSLCNEWKAVQDFNHRSRKLSVSILRAKTTQEDVFDVSMKYKLRCAACGEIAEIKKVNEIRKAALASPCAICCYSLTDFPPSSKYLRNTRGRNRSCQRCLEGKPPMWSIVLSQVCRNITSKSNILSYMIIQLGMSTRYRVPWHGGLPRIAIILNTRFAQPYRLGQDGERIACGGPTTMPLQHFQTSNRASTLWEYKGWAVVRRRCCSASWRGYRCSYCTRRHGPAVMDGSLALRGRAIENVF